MRNAPLLKLDERQSESADRSPHVVGDVPALRVALLMGLLFVPILGVGARLVRLQGQLTGEFAAAWQTTTFSKEPIPCRDGRILSADGQVLAHDRLRYDILVHYRWLEDPPDERWLTQQALSRLHRRDRRRTAMVENARQAVLRDRMRMWELLAATLNRPQSELRAARAESQQRVERIVESVTRRRDERLTESASEIGVEAGLVLDESSPLSAAWWNQLQGAVVGQLTTPPQRGRLDPVIVAEELEHHVVAIDVPLEPVSVIETSPSLFPGVMVRMSRERVYPQADAAGHLIGVRTLLRPDETARDDGLAHGTGDAPDGTGDRVGRNGVERSFDGRLRGRPGIRRIVRDRSGIVLAQETVQEPVPGEDVVLTIDLGLQRTAERLLDDAITPTTPTVDPGTSAEAPAPQGGCLVVLDVRTGDVLAAAAAPRHDVQLLIRPEPDEWQAAVSDPRRPFFPRVTQMTMPPGSVFKILTAVALLESGRIDPDEPFFCQGYLDRPDRNRCYVFRHYGVGHGDVTLSDAICQSCNVYFFNAAKTLGPAAIADWAGRFGLGEATGAEIPGERGGHLPRADGTGRIVGEPWYAGSTLQLAIGQASLTVTPLQVARMVAAVANGGYLVTPRFVSPRGSGPATVPEDSSRSGLRLVGFENVALMPPIQRIPGLSSETLQRVREAMTQVVQSPHGTGRRAAVEGITIAGKTGTAEVGGGKPDHAWFVGFVPAEAPRYAFAIVLEHGGSGGSTSAPMAKAFIEAMADAGLLRRQLPVEPASE
ncbi:MAG: peptidoglycan D,D-transpeptidase FtsI family protein [Planctomycetaceae bacterium]